MIIVASDFLPVAHNNIIVEEKYVKSMVAKKKLLYQKLVKPPQTSFINLSSLVYFLVNWRKKKVDGTVFSQEKLKLV